MQLSLYDRYCIEVCNGKCCYYGDGLKCPNLGSDFKCAIYSKWKNNTCNYSPGRGHGTTSIEDALKRNLLSAVIVAQCCYAHPELLTKVGA